uniref:Pre-rRNA-processing protein TSR2 homolog n=1 Tax=Periophthalmus magnuspinnatus TaxID=409849 RepID=A0A3B3ZFP6_9GOBI
MAASSSASRELFTAGVRAVLHNWPVLQIAVDNGFGGVYGQQKADWMVDVLQQYFHDNADLQQYEVEDYISTLMDQEFDTVVDDGSLPQVGKKMYPIHLKWDVIFKIYGSVWLETLFLLLSMECDAAAPVVNGTHSMTNFVPSSSSAENEEEDDGWTVVRRKK